MTNTFDRRSGLRSDLRPLPAMDSAAGPVTELRTSKFTIAGIRRRLEARLLMTSQRFVEVPAAVMRPSLVYSAPGDTGGGSTAPTISSASRPGGDNPPEGYSRLRFRLTSVAPLVMHNGQLANPLNRFAREMKKISGKRAKTEADYAELAKLEFMGSLYVSNGEPCIPGEILEAALVSAAQKVRRGNQARAGIVCERNFALEYEGPHAAAGLWDDERFRLSVGVRVQKNRIIRTRPIFRDWRCKISVDFMPSQLNKDEVAGMVRTAGTIIGIGDWRPKFGRFTAEML